MIPFACPICQTILQKVAPDQWLCPMDGEIYRRVDGIWRMMPAFRLAHYQQFIHEYETIRLAEGRAGQNAAYYRQLPQTSANNPWHKDWQIRARTFETLLTKVLPQIGQNRRLLDMGAGNGWLAYQLSKRGHEVAGIDLTLNPQDGLAAHIFYDTPWLPVQAEFDHLPFPPDSLDGIIFNASLHYSTDYQQTLAESLRVLRPQGWLIVMDSPIYHNGQSGAQMIKERESQFQQKYGFPSNSLPSQQYLTFSQLEQLAQALQIRWHYHYPFYGWRWAARPWLAKWRGQREPATFALLVGQKSVGISPT